MTKTDIHKSFHAPVVAVLDTDGVILNTDAELDNLKKDVHAVTDIAQYHLTEELLNEYTEFCALHKRSLPCSTVGRLMNIETPPEIYTGHKTGNSRFREIYNNRLFREIKAWKERREMASGVSERYASQGFKRTANGNKPTNLKPKMSLSAADKNYAYITNNPFEDGVIVLRMVICGIRRDVVFDFDTHRFQGAYKITLPDIIITDSGELRFIFTAAYSYIYSQFSDTYVVSVDVGVNTYATVSVINAKTGDIVYSSTLSSLCHSLYNRVRNANKQISTLQRKGLSEDAKTHRQSNSRRKRELAIRAAQEIAQLSAEWGNALVAIEDLSWITNTMEHGRWNRGELVRWVEFYAQLNGCRVKRVSAAHTSRQCPECHEEVRHPEWGISVCKNQDCSRFNIYQNRDVAATEVIAQRFIKGDWDKFQTTRRKAKKFTKKIVQRSPDVNKRKGYRSDRTKSVPTSKRPKKNKGTHKVWTIHHPGKGVIVAESYKLRSAPQTEELDVRYNSKGMGGMTVKSTAVRISEKGIKPSVLAF